MKGYKLDCSLSSKDTHVLSCSEDGHVYCWDLVEVTLHLNVIFQSIFKGSLHNLQNVMNLVMVSL